MSLILPKKYKTIDGFLNWAAKNFFKSKDFKKTIDMIKKNPSKYYLQSAEEREYNIQEKEHILIKKIERILKKNAFDCALNKKGNIFQEEVKKYKDCETSKNPILCSPLCDYTDCSYKCNYFDTNEEIKDEDLEIDTYTKLFARREIETTINLVKKYFKNNFVATIDILEEYVRTNADISYIESKFIYEAIKEMLDERITFKDKFNRECYIIYRDIYYILQPIDLSEDVPYSYRLMPIPTESFKEMDIGTFLKKAEVNTTINKQGIIETIEKLRKIKGYQFYVAMSHIPNNSLISILKYTIKYLQKNKKTKIFSKLLKFFHYSLVYDKNSNSSIESNIPIGYSENGNTWIWKDDKWLKTINQPKKISKEQHIVGFMEEMKNGKIIFKVRPPLSNLSESDKRKIKTGSVCKTTSKTDLKKIAEGLGLTISTSFTVNKMCRKIERALHKKQIHSNKNNLGQRWIYNILER